MILEVDAIDTHYGPGHILHGLSLAVGEGEVVALLGRNGAGKTTTLRSITGLTPPRKGAIRYKGRVFAGIAPHRFARLGIALVPETRGIFSYLSAREMRCGSRPAMSHPLYRMVPLRGGLRPVIEQSVVVLPAPLRPSSATTSPSATFSDRPWRMWPSP